MIGYFFLLNHLVMTKITNTKSYMLNLTEQITFVKQKKHKIELIL